MVVATGARPIEIPDFDADGEPVLTALEAVSLEQVPERLVVSGGGVIGLELGAMYAKVGHRVTIGELSGKLLPGIDRDLVSVVERRLQRSGVRVLTKARARGREQRGGLAVVRVEHEGGAEEIEADRVLVAIGEEEANRRGIPHTVGRFPFSVLGRSMSLGETEGFVKVIAGQDRVLGGGIVGPEASELIAEATFAIEMMAAPQDVGLTVHTHPTLSEALHEAMRHSVGEPIHIMNRCPRSSARTQAIIAD